MKKLVLIWAACIFVFGCKNQDEVADESDIQETAQQIGDIMASMDEQGGADGTVVALENLQYQKTFERFNQEPPPSVASNFLNLLVSPAEATACYSGGTGFGWGFCAGRVLTRSFQNCTIGTTVLSGDVTLTWAGNGTACDWGGSPVAGNSITRKPTFTITGRRNATLSVSASGTGQVLKYVSGSSPNMVFNFTNDGVRRKFTTALGAVLFDQTTTVASGTPIVVTGNARTNRVMSGGFLTITNNLTNSTCQLSPSNVTWNLSTCNCPTQGSWSGSCSFGSSSGSATLTLTGCGTGTYSEAGATTAVNFDRCSSN